MTNQDIMDLVTCFDRSTALLHIWGRGWGRAGRSRRAGAGSLVPGQLQSKAFAGHFHCPGRASVKPGQPR